MLKVWVLRVQGREFRVGNDGSKLKGVYVELQAIALVAILARIM